MPQLSKTGTTLSEINIIPLVDVVLVLLIIFMIAAPIIQSGIQVDLPKTKTVKAISEPRLVVTIDSRQIVYLGNEPANVKDLGSRVMAQLRTASGEISKEAVYVRADETVPFGVFATVMDALRQAGIENISVVTEPISSRAIRR